MSRVTGDCGGFDEGSA